VARRWRRTPRKSSRCRDVDRGVCVLRAVGSFVCWFVVCYTGNKHAPPIHHWQNAASQTCQHLCDGCDREPPSSSVHEQKGVGDSPALEQASYCPPPHPAPTRTHTNTTPGTITPQPPDHVPDHSQCRRARSQRSSGW
jgi:hypothetical protein